MDKINNWNDLINKEVEFANSGQEWIFRGQSKPSHRIRSTLDRACEDFGVPNDDIPYIEMKTYHEFKRSCHIYGTPMLPKDDDKLSWIALMRHYGGPTRFVDFTYSLFVASYFACESDRAQPTVWAINKTWLSKYMEKLILDLPDGKTMLDGWMNRKGQVFDKLFFDRDPKLDFVAPTNPYLMNDRLLVQQGLFLCSTDVQRPLHDALEAIPDSDTNVRCLIIEQEARPEILRRLFRVGMNRAALFPGLQGYAESLTLKIPHIVWLKENFEDIPKPKKDYSKIIPYDI